MNQSFFPAFLLICVISFGGFIGKTSASAELLIHEPRAVFIPKGFDDNDNVQIVLAGEFTSTCYKVGPSSVKVDPVRKEIRVRDDAIFHDGCCCTFMLVSYVKPIDLGILPAGKYSVLLEKDSVGMNSLLQGELTVAQSFTIGPDDHLYAPVSHAEVTARDELILKGNFKNSCMRMKKIKVQHQNHQKDPVIVILPVAEFSGSVTCRSGSFPFEERLQLPRLTDELTLIHVRSLNGQALNKVVER
jgi:hypothetical protein